MGQGGVACPKPISRKRLKGRKDRAEAKVKKSVRAQCVDRDGYCRVGDWERNPDDWHADVLAGDACEGPSQWCHMKTHRRSATRGQAPMRRHTTAASFIGCQKHHAQYDGRAKPRLFIEERIWPLGADGPLHMFYERRAE